MRILVTGAAGFIGHHAIARLQRDGHEMIGLCRDEPTGARRQEGVRYIGGVDVSDAATLRPDEYPGIDAVVHLVGIIIARPPKQTYQRVHVDGTRNVVQAARAAGAKRAVYISAIGASPDSPSEYARTKAEAEEIVRASGLEWAILRPSIVLGRDAGFTKQMQQLVHTAGLPFDIDVPVIPVPGSGRNLFQPIDIDDLTEGIARGVVAGSAATGQTVQVGGASQVSFNATIRAFAHRERVRKPLLHMPITALEVVAPVVELLPNPPFSEDQLKQLQIDNVTDLAAMRGVLGIEPKTFEQTMAAIYS